MFEVPSLRKPSVVQKVLSGKDEAPLIAFDLLGHPVRVRAGTDEDEQGSSGDGLGEPGEGILENEALKPSLPTTVDDVSVKADADVLCRLDLCDQVVGHAGSERVAAHEQRHARGVVRQVRRGLTGRVPSTYNVYLSSLHDLSLSHCGAVEHTRPA